MLDVRRTPQATTIESRAEAESLERLCAQYRKSYRSLHRQALRIVGTHEAAEDVLQQAFVNSAAAIKRGSEIDNFGAWLRTVVRNVALMALDTKTTMPLEEELTIASNDTPADTLQMRARCQDVYRTANSLPKAQRSAFLMAEIKGLDYREIARVLDRSETSVHGLLQRARANIRERAGSDLHSVPAWVGGLASLKKIFGLSDGSSLRDRLQARFSGLHSWTGTVVERANSYIPQLANSGTVVAAAALVVVATSSSPSPTYVSADLSPNSAVHRQGPAATSVDSGVAVAQASGSSVTTPALDSATEVGVQGGSEALADESVSGLGEVSSGAVVQAVVGSKEAVIIDTVSDPLTQTPSWPLVFTPPVFKMIPGMYTAVSGVAVICEVAVASGGRHAVSFSCGGSGGDNPAGTGSGSSGDDDDDEAAGGSFGTVGGSDGSFGDVGSSSKNESSDPGSGDQESSETIESYEATETEELTVTEDDYAEESAEPAYEDSTEETGEVEVETASSVE